jgi:hypothetical protein
MKVWVVVGIDHKDAWLVGVFTDEAKAELEEGRINREGRFKPIVCEPIQVDEPAQKVE